MLDATTGQLVHTEQVVAARNDLGGFQTGGAFAYGKAFQHGLDATDGFTSCNEGTCPYEGFNGTVAALSANGSEVLWRVNTSRFAAARRARSREPPRLLSVARGRAGSAHRSSRVGALTPSTPTPARWKAHHLPGSSARKPRRGGRSRVRDERQRRTTCLRYRPRGGLDSARGGRRRAQEASTSAKVRGDMSTKRSSSW